MNLSVSRLKSFTYCGEKYRLEKVEYIPAPPGAWTILGTAFHYTYEAWERSGRVGALRDGFGEQYERAIQEQLVAHPIETWERRPRIPTVRRDLELYLQTGLQQCDTYEDHCRSAEWQLATLRDGSLALELQSEYQLTEDIIIRFAADKVLRWPDGRLTVRDLKTGKLIDDNRQIGFYKVLLKEVFSLEISYGEYWYTKLNRSGGWVDLNRYTEEYMRDQFNALWSAHQGSVFIANPGKQCDLCSVRQHCREKGWKV